MKDCCCNKIIYRVDVSVRARINTGRHCGGPTRPGHGQLGIILLEHNFELCMWSSRHDVGVIDRTQWREAPVVKNDCGSETSTVRKGSWQQTIAAIEIAALLSGTHQTSQSLSLQTDRARSCGPLHGIWARRNYYFNAWSITAATQSQGSGPQRGLLVGTKRMVCVAQKSALGVAWCTCPCPTRSGWLHRSRRPPQPRPLGMLSPSRYPPLLLLYSGWSCPLLSGRHSFRFR